jgi:hypothetical protein
MKKTLERTRSFSDNTGSGTPEDFKNDFQTPVPVARYMVSLLPQSCNPNVVGVVRSVLEPTPGVGHIKTALLDAGYDVTAPDDYFLLDRKKRFDGIVMNPPFSQKFTIMHNAPVELQSPGMRMGYWFLTDCMKRSNNVIALMPWFTISDSDVRLRYLVRFGLKALIALPRKTFQFARIQTVIIVLQKGYKGDTIFKAWDCLNDASQPPLL